MAARSRALRVEWSDIAKTADKHGFEWGGDWKTPDKPHFQKTSGLSIPDLKKGKRPPKGN